MLDNSTFVLAVVDDAKTISGIFFWWGANTTCTIYSTSGVFIAMADSYCSTSLLAVTGDAQTISTLYVMP
jgi:hypothetical protein